MHELDGACIEAGAAKGVAAYGQHFCAAVHASDLGTRIDSEQFGQKAAVAFAEQQDFFSFGDFGKELDSALLQLISGEQPFHPAIGAGQAIEPAGDHIKRGLAPNRGSTTSRQRPR